MPLSCRLGARLTLAFIKHMRSICMCLVRKNRLLLWWEQMQPWRQCSFGQSVIQASWWTETDTRKELAQGRPDLHKKDQYLTYMHASLRAHECRHWNSDCAVTLYLFPGSYPDAGDTYVQPSRLLPSLSHLTHMHLTKARCCHTKTPQEENETTSPSSRWGELI